MSLNNELLHRHIQLWKDKLAESAGRTTDEQKQRADRAAYYQSKTRDKILSMNVDDFYEYISKLWAMLIWGNKKYVIEKLISDNGFETIKQELANLVWGAQEIDQRWDQFRAAIKGMGPAMMSEVLCHSHPDKYMIWNRRAYVGLNYLGIDDLPRHNYQAVGKRYHALCETAKVITKVMRNEGIPDANLLTLDYFIWDELQVEENLSQIYKKPTALATEEEAEEVTKSESVKAFLHDEVRDKVAQIGLWLSFRTETEVKVAQGAVVDAVWEATIGNLGRVIYVFEVQTKGSIDSLIVNLLKSLNNPAVQGIVAVSDTVQIEKIKNEAKGVPQLKEKLKYWNYNEVLLVHEALESVNESINSLGLVPESILKV